MVNELAKKKQQPLTPGFGVAGLVMCPFMSLTHPAQCMKQGCELWVELQCGENKVARCSLAWLAVLATETRASIEKLGGLNVSRNEKSTTETP